VLTSARAFSRRRSGTRRTSWLAALRRRCRGKACHARCVELALKKELHHLYISSDGSLQTAHAAVFIAVCIASISNARACYNFENFKKPGTIQFNSLDTSANFSTSIELGKRFMP